MNRPNTISFCDTLEHEMLDTENIQVSVTKAKGFITLFWSITFSEGANLICFNKHKEEINLANSKIEQIGNKYKEFLFKTRFLTEKDVIHFDHIYATTITPPVKTAWRSNSQSFGGFAQFKYLEEEYA